VKDRDVGVFVGRASELAALDALERSVRRGRPAAAVVIAEPGLGKSQLLAEFADGVGFPLVRLFGYEPAREVPLAAAGGLLRELSGTGEVGQRLELLLRGHGGASVARANVRVFEAAFRCLVERDPFAVLIDDLQWVDSETLALIHYLVAACERERVPLLMLGAGRPAAEPRELSSALGKLLEPERFVALSLGPLTLGAGLELMGGFTPGLGRREAEAIWHRANGSPFWLRALALGDESADSPLNVVRAGYENLDTDSARLFALLVVAAQPLGLTDAGELLDFHQKRTAVAAHTLVKRGLLVHEGPMVRVVHDLVREAALSELPERQRRSHNRRLAAWLEGSADDDLQLLASALEHRLAAGIPAAELALRIVRCPQRRLLGGEGLSTLGAIADESVGADAALLPREVAALASELGEWQVAFERWAALADRGRDPTDQAQAALAAATAGFRLGRPSDVHEFAARARQGAEVDPLLEIEADCLDVQALLWLEGDPGPAQPLVDGAMAAADRLLEKAGAVEALSDAECGTYVRAVRGKLDAAIRRADADTVAQCAALIQHTAREPAEVLTAASDAVFSMLQFDGAPGPAEPRARRALEESRPLALPSLEVEATHWAGWIAHHRGRLDQAAELMDRAVALAERVGAPRRFTVPILRALAHSVEASRGGWRDRVAAIEKTIGSEPDPHFRLVVRIIHVWLVGRFSAPKTSSLDSWLSAMEADAQVAGCGRCLWESVLHGAEASARIGDARAARAALLRWDAAQPHPGPGPAARRAYTGALLTARRDARASLPQFSQAAQLAKAAGHDLMRLWIELDRADVLGAVDRDEAVVALNAVVRDAEGMHAMSERDLALRRLRSLGIRTWRRGRSGEAGALSERERQIADLVASGASNPEIAQALFLSRKTIERHVSNLLAKVDARNRAELVARLAGNDLKAKGEGVTR
jgi:DNA-binding NarL/FixJ family response regulator